ncbi:MAG: hypothetical protein DRP81_04740 [Candidatus Omnitrophota bacterium]|nr:MAG: hypothetical protein DRP81_04740 [Candidatus Omnitrophota bacterium]
MREKILSTGEVYHIFTKSIANFKIFKKEKDFLRIIDMMAFYQRKNKVSFAIFEKNKSKVLEENNNKNNDKIVKIIAYCIMPTHIHLILTQLEEKGISVFMSNLLNSYTRYFNLKHNRKGPLWESRFKRIHIDNNEILLHLTRYIHLNPVTAYLVDNPIDWEYSSYREYLSCISLQDCICQFKDIIEIEPESYKKFVEDRISYQRELAKIKHLIIE